MSGTILVQVHTVARQLDDVSTLEHARAEADDVRATFDALNEVRPFLIAATSPYLCVHSRLNPERIVVIENQLRLLADSLRVLKETFARDRRQARQLQGPVRAQAQQLYTMVTAGWREAAESRARPLLQLLDLVQRLPEMQGQHGVVVQLRTRLQAGIERLPQSESQISAFDADCAALETLLDEMRGLSAPVKAFLANVAERKARLSDLSDEVLAWCRQGTRASAFSITFAEVSE